MALDSIKGINFKGVAPSVPESVPENKEDNKKGLSKTEKALIGVGTALAITGSVVGGMLYVKHAKFNKALNGIMDSIEKIQNQFLADDFYASKFDMTGFLHENQMIRHFAKNSGLKRAKDVKEQYEIMRTYAQNDLCKYSINNLISNPQTKSAKYLKELIENPESSKNFENFRLAYIEACKDFAKLEDTKLSPAVGKNVQETVDLFIEKRLLPNGVKPHNYDLSKELDIATCNYFGGYKEYMLRNGLHSSERSNIFTDNYFAPYNVMPQTVKSKQYNSLVSSFYDSANETNVVTLRLPKAGITCGQDESVVYKIGIGNKNGALTPVQKDLIEVGGRLNEEEVQQFATLLHAQENMDSDAVLSLIQHFANDAKFMARPVNA